VFSSISARFRQLNPFWKSLATCREKRKKFIANFHVLGLFIAKKLDLSEKKNFRMSRAGAVAVASR
jgi:hypothetical protein